LDIDLNMVVNTSTLATLFWVIRSVNKLLTTSALYGWRLKELEKKVYPEGGNS
jgi:hypothetical protein